MVGILAVLLVLGILFFGLSDLVQVRQNIASGFSAAKAAGAAVSGDGGSEASGKASSTDPTEEAPGKDASSAQGAADVPTDTAVLATFGKLKKPNVKMGPFSYFKQIEPRENMTVCGVTYAEEPYVKVTTEPDHRCKCYSSHCNDIDYPTHSYVMLGVTGKKKDVLASAMENVYSTHNEKQGPTVETIVHSAGLRYPQYNALMQSLVGNKVDRDGYMRNSFLVFTEAGRKDEEMRDGLIRFSNGLRVSVSKEGDDFNGLNRLQSRIQAHGQDSSQKCKKSNSYDNSFIIQYYKRPRNIVQIVKRLKAQKGKNEILVNDDSGTEVGVWIRELEKGDPIRYTVLVSGNIHEIRGYNRLAKLAQGKLLVLMQDDDYPSYGGRWLRHAQHLFKKNDKLGLVGGFTGTIQGGPMTNKYGVGRAPIKFKSGFRQPFMFATLVNMGPFFIRRSYFLESGMFNGNFSCRGEPGIGFDYEFALRTWYLGYHVGVFKSEMDYHVGDWSTSGTRRNRGLYKKRQMIERRNTRYHKGTYGPRDPKQCPDCLDIYYRQGLHGRANQFSTPYNKLKGVGIKVHDLNYALKKNATNF